MRLLLLLMLFASPMFGEETFSMIKPDAVKQHHIGDILAIYEKNGLEIVDLKMVRLSKEEAQKFYSVHASRPFYGELVNYVTSGPVVAFVLKGDNAVQKARDLIGATDPKKAAAGTIRSLYGTSVQANAVHGSDSADNALVEIKAFFPTH